LLLPETMPRGDIGNPPKFVERFGKISSRVRAFLRFLDSSKNPAVFG